MSWCDHFRVAFIFVLRIYDQTMIWGHPRKNTKKHWHAQYIKDENKDVVELQTLIHCFDSDYQDVFLSNKRWLLTSFKNWMTEWVCYHIYYLRTIRLTAPVFGLNVWIYNNLKSDITSRYVGMLLLLFGCIHLSS